MDDIMIALKLTKIGNSVGVLFPKELLSRLHAEVGDTVYLTESPDGARVTPYNPNFADQMEVAERVMKKRRSVLRELAK
jgi:putative addiction module antidote